jgi:hypothetical protein
MKNQLDTLEDFFRLDPDLQDYLRNTFIDPQTAVHFAYSAAKTRELLQAQWQEIYDECVKEEESLDWTPLTATQIEIAEALNLFNCVLAILFRKDWDGYQEQLFGHWIPIGLKQPAKEERIEILRDPLFQNDIEFINSDEIELCDDGLLWYEGEAVLFWKPVVADDLPVNRIPYLQSGEVQFNLWKNADIEKLLPELLPGNTGKGRL